MNAAINAIDGKTVVQRYVDILTDAGFKAVFGDQRNKDVLIDLLNVMLPPHRKVKDITYQTTEIPSFSLFNKSTRLDLRCKGEDGIAEGRAEEKIRIAKAFKEKGVDASIIASATGLSETQISEL